MPYFKNIVGAEAIEAPTTSSLREGSSPTPKNLLKVSEFDRKLGSFSNDDGAGKKNIS